MGNSPEVRSTLLHILGYSPGIGRLAIRRPILGRERQFGAPFATPSSAAWASSLCPGFLIVFPMGSCRGPKWAVKTSSLNYLSRSASSSSMYFNPFLTLSMKSVSFDAPSSDVWRDGDSAATAPPSASSTWILGSLDIRAIVVPGGRFCPLSPCFCEGFRGGGLCIELRSTRKEEAPLQVAGSTYHLPPPCSIARAVCLPLLDWVRSIGWQSPSPSSLDEP